MRGDFFYRENPYVHIVKNVYIIPLNPIMKLKIKLVAKYDDINMI